jgi:hypothetical protein
VKLRKARERVRPAEEPWEEVVDPVELKIESRFQLVDTARPRESVRELHTVDRILAGTEVVASHEQDRLIALPDERLGIVAVGVAVLFVARVLKPEFIEQAVLQKWTSSRSASACAATCRCSRGNCGPPFSNPSPVKFWWLCRSAADVAVDLVIGLPRNTSDRACGSS